MIRKIKIGKPTQNNGLWGMPSCVKRFEPGMNRFNNDRTLESAIINAFCEFHNIGECSISINDDSIRIHLWRTKQGVQGFPFYEVKYQNCYIENNDTLVYLDGIDLIKYNRKYKVKKLFIDHSIYASES